MHGFIKPHFTGKHLERYSELGHPYVRTYGIGDDFTWVLTMSPLMSEVLSVSECVEVDITYRTAIELQYLFNAVAFTYITMRCKCTLFFRTYQFSYDLLGMIVARVRLNRIDTDAYAQCFRAIFEQVTEDHPTFKIGQSLTGIIADWSDQQANGLVKVVGKPMANEILKGCQVYIIDLK